MKVLPEAFVSDPERLARFQREAEVLASLNYPNIAQTYGLEDSGDTTALVLELVEGPTLAERIAQVQSRSMRLSTLRARSRKPSKRRTLWESSIAT